MSQHLAPSYFSLRPAPNPPGEEGASRRAQILAIHAQDPLGAAGLSADALTLAAFGAHMHGVSTGVFISDSLGIQDFYALEQEAVQGQASAILEDAPIDAIKIGFLGSLGNVQTVAEILSDYPDIPVVTAMDDLSWWEHEAIEDYLDAFAHLILPMSDVLVGQSDTLARWLLPDFNALNEHNPRRPSARDYAAKIIADYGQEVYVLLTGQAHDTMVGNSLADAKSTLVKNRFERLEKNFSGTLDVVSAAFTTLIANDYGLMEAFNDSFAYTEQTLRGGFQPGMGLWIADRLPEEPHSSDPPKSN